ncbi:MD-2-related lipid-recognition protein-like [Leptopilina heterotoma]|uniref:MD-2-related lipid-recognition protein-like n=1 Tax=Leptopilina heterotoma TaxID=63436 RepID=UPI001CA7E8D8|nr:MD-2-related lipid-recognition protein-like [Leptopilina heterotoma]
MAPLLFIIISTQLTVIAFFFHSVADPLSRMINQSAIAFVLLLICTAFAEEVQWHYCTPESQDLCTIQNVQVDPCKEAVNNLPCRLKKGLDAQISFNYTANFNAENASSQAYWDSGILDLPLAGMNTDACKNTKCPIVKNENSNYDIKIHINKLFPSKEFKVKWKLWDNAQQNELCCFTINIKIHL